MFRIIPWSLAIATALSFSVHAQWLPVSSEKVWMEQTDLAGPRVMIEYELADPSITEKSPAWVFVRYRLNPESPWRLLAPDQVQGNAVGIVDAPGPKQSVWWGTGERNFADLAGVEFRIRAIPMARVPAGEFALKGLPGQGRDQSGRNAQRTNLPTFHIARFETTTAMYAEYLNEAGTGGTGYNGKMDNLERCGIVKDANGLFAAAPGRETYPVAYVSWYDAAAFLEWCGLRLPDEPEWEKAYRGGNFLDGDETKQEPNPNPARRYPWGDELPNADGVQRCNYDGEGDGFPNTAPVGSFPNFASPYGVHDMAGNVTEWTLNWYTTSYHAGIDGYRVVRGGSWLDLPEGCDGISGATTLPIKEGATMGFRGVYAPESNPEPTPATAPAAAPEQRTEGEST